MRRGAGPLGHKPEIRAQGHQERQQAQGASEQGQGPAGLHGGEGWISGSWGMKSLVIQIPGSLRKEEALPPGLLGESSSWGSWGTCGPSDQTSLVSPSSWWLTRHTSSLPGLHRHPPPTPRGSPHSIWWGEGPGGVTLSVVWVGRVCLYRRFHTSCPWSPPRQRGLPVRGEREAWEAQRWGVVSEARV